MILSDQTIQWRLDTDLVVEPEPTVEQIQPASLDLRLGREVYDVANDERTHADAHTLQPGRQYLGHTLEEMGLPNDLAAQLTGRSTIGRMGVIVHKTAGWVDPGFNGTLTLELYNFHHEPVKLESGRRVAQLVFFPLDAKSSGYDGKYQNQTKPTKYKQDDA